MSYDLMVFDPVAAPREREAFLSWFEGQATWSEGHGYDDPVVSTSGLRAWFADAIATFPAMNGPYAPRNADLSEADADADPDDESRAADYSVGRVVIYVAFAWSKAPEAYELVLSLAAKHGLGFYDVSSAMGEVWLPDQAGTLSLAHLDQEAERQKRQRDALVEWVRAGVGEPSSWVGGRPESDAEADAAAERHAAEEVERLRAYLARVGGRDGESNEAATWWGHALEDLLSQVDGMAEGVPRRAALLGWDKRAEGLGVLRVGDAGLLLYPRPAAARVVGDGHLVTAREIVSSFSLTLAGLSGALARVGHPRPAALAEALLTSAATAVLRRETQFHDGALLEFRTVTAAPAAHPHEISLAEARALDLVVAPGEELGFVTTWRGWLYPLLDWLYASQAARAR